jgi:hypothetical protein
MMIRRRARAVVTTLAIMAIAPSCGGDSPTAPARTTTTATLAITSISPNNGPTAGATSVTIRGMGFVPGATVTFDAAAADISVVISTMIVATLPAHTAGAVDVVVTNPGGQSSRLPGAFTYGADLPYVLTADANTVRAGDQLKVSWTAPIGGVLDWIGLLKVGDPSTNYESGWWQYTDGALSGTFTLRAPTEPGLYEFRYWLDDGFVEVVRSSPITVR